MSESLTETLLKDYQPYPYLLPKTELRFELLGESEVRVHAKLHFMPNPAAKPGTLVLNGGPEVGLELLAIDGVEIPREGWTRLGEELTLAQAPQAPFTLESTVRIDPAANTALSGLYTSGGKFCTQCESDGFRNITFFPDRPDVLSVFTTTITADATRYPQLLSNGNLLEERAESGLRTAMWHDPFPKPSYLFALVAADLEILEDHHVTASGRTVTLRMYTDKSMDAEANLRHAMTSLQKSMAWDERVFGLEYDLDLFMVVAVEDFNFGAMENKGLNIFNSKVLLASPETATDARHHSVESIVAHEYFHNWTGNRITCRDWFQLCLKEGLTVFRDQEFSSDMHSRTVQRIQDVNALRARQFPEDAGPNAHPIRPEAFLTVENFYTATVYEKGAEVIRMIHTLLGAEGFRKGMDLYFARHDGQAVTTEDFVAAMADANGADLTQFERGWYHQAGTPILTADDDYDAASGSYSLTLRQSCPFPAVPKEPYHIPVRFGLLDAQGHDLALHPDAETTRHVQNDILHLRTPEQRFVFTGLHARPLPSLLRGFSAPVTLDYAYDRPQLAFLLAHDADGFNAWEAGQRLMVAAIKDRVEDLRTGHAPRLDPSLVEALRRVLADHGRDKAMVAEWLSLPSHSYLCELYEKGQVEPIWIEVARRGLERALAVELEAPLRATYEANRGSESRPYRFECADIGERALKNIVLFYLAQIPRHVALASRQLRDARNMTDEQGALNALAYGADAAARDTGLMNFHDKWARDPIVIDQWLRLHTVIDRAEALEMAQGLMAGPHVRDAQNAAKLKPNKVNAVLGGFMGNPVQFHREDGAGYRFLAAQVLVIDAANPRLAARLVAGLTDWEKYMPIRAMQMRDELAHIHRHPGLSTDTSEIVGKALG